MTQQEMIVEIRETVARMDERVKALDVRVRDFLKGNAKDHEDIRRQHRTLIARIWGALVLAGTALVGLAWRILVGK